MSIFKQGKLSKPEFVSKMICTLLSILIFGLVTSLQFPGDKGGEVGLMHAAFNWVFGVLTFFYIVILMRKSLDENLEFDFSEATSNTNYYAGVKTLIVTLLLLTLGITSFDQSKLIYNASVEYQNENIRIIQSKETFYDNYWKSYQLTDDVVIKNKETLMEVTNIVMNARKDGDKLTWKWLQENQPIPYTEFTKFYSGLIEFVQSQRAGLLAIENQHQDLAKANNILLDTFPNVIYNKVLNRERIDYKPGFTSTRTQKVFKTGIEDLK
jgi:hypothetical protein